MDSREKRPLADELASGSDEQVAKRLRHIAVGGLESAQTQLNFALQDEAAAREDQAAAHEAGDKQKVKEAKAEVKKAEEKVKKAEEKVKQAEEKVKQAKAEVKEVAAAAVAAVATAVPADQFDLATEEGCKRLVEELGKKKWGLRTDRFKMPMRLTSDTFRFGQTQEREAAFDDLLETWAANCKAGMGGREKLPLPAVPAGPGTGKTRFAWLAAARGCFPGRAALDAEWQKAMDKLEADDFKKGIQNAVGLAVTFNCDADPIPGEEHQFMIGVRMLYGCFCNVNAVTLVDFLQLLRNHGCHQITSMKALEIIEWDIEANHVALDGGAKRHVILVVDEPLRALRKTAAAEPKEDLGALTSSVGQLITNYPHVHVLMTSLSGSDLTEASQTASGRPVHFIQGFNMLSKAAIVALVAAEPDIAKRAWLERPKFQRVLGECLGVPRLLEKVFEAAASPEITIEAPCDTVRTFVAGLFKSHDKYRDRKLRGDALVAALSGSWRPASDEREQRTRAAEREGYLFDRKIPALLLKWWWGMDDECRQADEMHALLQAANGIYTLSDEVGGAEHGPRFERQLAHLWRILTITDAVSRREASGTPKRTIHGMLGKGQLVGADDAVSARSLNNVAAAFNKGLVEVDVGLLLRPFEELDKPATGSAEVPADPVHCTPYFPNDRQNPGFDFAMEEPTADDGGSVVQVLVEAKFSAEEAATAPLSKAAIASKYVKAIQSRPTVRDRLLAGQLCYVIGGLREMQDGVMQDVDSVASAIVAALREQDVARHQRLLQLVRGSLVLLTRGHTAALLTSTLSSLPPFDC